MTLTCPHCGHAYESVLGQDSHHCVERDAFLAAALSRRIDARAAKRAKWYASRGLVDLRLIP